MRTLDSFPHGNETICRWLRVCIRRRTEQQDKIRTANGAAKDRGKCQEAAAMKQLHKKGCLWRFDCAKTLGKWREKTLANKQSIGKAKARHHRWTESFRHRFFSSFAAFKLPLLFPPVSLCSLHPFIYIYIFLDCIEAWHKMMPSCALYQTHKFLSIRPKQS